jgi:NAD-dependent SIR2 family protein deacetylase
MKGADRLRDLIGASRRVDVFTGVGISSESGIHEDQVIELHGNTTYAACLGCGKRFELEPIRTTFERDETLPVCDRCPELKACNIYTLDAIERLSDKKD